VASDLLATEEASMASRKPKLKPRKPGAWRGWAADLPDEVFLAPMDPEDLDAAEGLNNDDWGITLPDKLPKGKPRPDPS
jgi:hypothetical protein